ncbi:MAG: pyridoxal 5'-phosphate synthase glutaminase subunit PdxT [Bacillota bacterium]
MKIGVLALQGAFREHEQMLRKLDSETVQVRREHDLEGIDGLIIPGGESTTIGKLLIEWQLFDKIKEMGASGLPVFGTCAGMILLAKDIVNSDQPRLGLMDMLAHRNAFGRQVDSFEADLQIPVLGEEPYRGVFIRAPFIKEVRDGVEVLCTYNDKIVLARQGNFLAAAFHPELTDDDRVHRLFLEMAGK